MGGLHHQQRCCLSERQDVELCRQADHGKLHMRHGLSAWGNLALWKGVLLTKSDFLVEIYAGMPKYLKVAKAQSQDTRFIAGVPDSFLIQRP